MDSAGDSVADSHRIHARAFDGYVAAALSRIQVSTYDIISPTYRRVTVYSYPPFDLSGWYYGIARYGDFFYGVV